MTSTVPTELGDVEVHPAAEMFPLMRGPTFDDLVADIRDNGLDQPIVRTPDGAVLDGRNRLRACLAAGVEPRFTVSTEEPWRFVISANLHRRELTCTERALVAAKLAERANGSNQHRVTKVGSPNDEPTREEPPPTREQARQLLGVSTGSLDRAKRVLRDGIVPLKALTEAGQVSLAAASRIAALDPDQQKEFVTQVEAGASCKTKPTKPDPEPAPLAERRAMTQRGARYRYVQESALRLLADSFDGLAIVLDRGEGLDPAITNEEAARWRGDLSRKAKSFRQLMTLLKERSE